MKQAVSFRVWLIAAIGVVVGLVVPASAGLTDAQKCESFKLKHTGKYAFCQMKAQSKFVKTADMAKLMSDLAKCDSKIEKLFGKADDPSKWGPSCPAGTDDVGTMESEVTQCTDDWAALLSGLPVVRFEDNGDGTISDNETGLMWAKKTGTNGSPSVFCDVDDCPADNVFSGLLSGGPDSFEFVIDATGSAWTGEVNTTVFGLITDFSGTVAGNLTFSGSGFSGNIFIDGTIDCAGQTVSGTYFGLANGTFNGAADTDYCPDLHDVANRYTWSESGSDPDGTAFTNYLARLNSQAFGGHTDWRLPTRLELASITDDSTFDPATFPAFDGAACVGGCSNITETQCSCTASSEYWSSTSYAFSPTTAWFVSFFGGYVDFDGKAYLYHVRAVRGGS
jgi:hypothetical protein